MPWLNGQLLDSAEARIDPADRGFTLGDGLYETIRFSAGAPHHFLRHMARLRHGADFLEIPLPYNNETLLAAIVRVTEREALVSAAMRLTLTRGPAAQGLVPAESPLPTVLITAGPLAAPLPAVRLMIATCTRRNEQSPLARLKSLSYLDSILARQEAIRAGADDAILLNTRGLLAEATAANLFILKNGAWLTPPIADGALPGIMRGLLIERYGAREQSLTEADLETSEGAFLSNALGIRPVASIGSYELPPISGISLVDTPVHD